jgi:Zn-dependent M28 family amino/carboxypeptidase
MQTLFQKQLAPLFLLIALHTQCQSPETLNTSIEAQRKALELRPLVNFVRLADSSRLMANTEALSNKKMEGRLTGSQGNAMARQYIINQLSTTGVKPLGQNWSQEFSFSQRGQTLSGTNLIGLLKGTAMPDSFIVLSAHYDHLGIQNGVIFPGADDNGSGVSTLIEAANYFTAHPSRYSLVFCFFDAEEEGLKGAFHFTAHLPAPLSLSNIRLNINLDMVSRNHYGNEIFLCGTLANSFLKPLLSPAQATTNIHMLYGHEGEPGTKEQDNWIMQSDPGPFALLKIPYLYLGVEDHPDYHKPSDSFEKIDKAFYYQAANLIITLIQLADEGIKA